MTAPASSEFSFDPFSAEVVADPDRWYRQLRDEHPVYYNADYDTFFFSRFQDVWDVLRIGKNALLATETNLPTADRLREHRNTGAPPLASTNPMAPGPQLASPEYEQMHQLHIGPLRPRSVAALEQFVRDMARKQLDELLPRGEFNLTTDYVAIIPARVICHLFGLPLEVADQVIANLNAIGRYKTGRSGVDLTSFFSELQKYILPAIEARRAAGADGSNGMIDGLINYRQPPESRAFSDAEIADQLVCAMVGGMESVPKVTGGGILELWKHPEQLAAVREDLGANLAIASQEMIRFCAPAQYTFRTAHQPVVVAGQAVRPGQRVAAMLYSAARDEREFENPDSFVWNRPIPRVISFGMGQHHCIGKYLAQMEVRVLAQEFLSRVRDFEFDLADAGGNAGYFQRGWISLPVRILR
ncbi:cytochrome P450 [Mangrovimicrobium sediminis]|uniref:Cytochrome P450 n=1 Tax=Mangrovimicrobium sediminis TaxID=2562682 RepID=A0A4Z0LYQ6_9GAMM|nr:cytochrome P450 [Haliea sp. SAOS-164]TGD72513.1 cytochrome P450 [Haliea sp. SAOS-164]